MKIAIRTLIIVIILSSCSAIGTKTLYKTSDEFDIRKVGFCRLESEDKISQIFHNLDKTFDSAVIQTFQKERLGIPKQIPTDMSYDNPDLTEIRELCNKNDIDGFLIAKLTFMHVEYTIYSEPIFQNFDTEVELILFDRSGEMLISTLHNTFHGNSYMKPPQPNKTIYDGTKGAIKRLAKEMR